VTTLQTITADAQEVLNSVHAATQAIHAAVHDVDTLKSTITNALTAADAEIEKVSHDVSSWNHDAVDVSHQLTSLSQSTYSTLQPLQTALAHMQQSIHDESASIQNLIASLTTVAQTLEHDATAALQDFSDRLGHAVATVEQLIEHESAELWTQCEQQLGEFSTAVSKVHSQMDELAQNAQTALKNAEDGLLSQIHDVSTEVQQHAITEHLQLAERVIQDNVSSVRQAEEQFLRSCDDQCDKVVDSILDGVRRHVDDVGHQLLGVSNQSGSVREILKPLIGQLDEMQNPLEDVVSNVSSIASELGVSV
jgi:chromosome segregation ATPase